METVHSAWLLVFISCVSCRSDQPVADSFTSVRDMLRTIAPTYKLARLPPGFPSLKTISTDKFTYKTKRGKLFVSTKLDKPVEMFGQYVQLSNVDLIFIYNKKRPRNGKWKTRVKGSWAVGSSVFHLNVSSNGTFAGQDESLQLNDVLSAFLPKDRKRDIGLDPSSIALQNVSVTGRVNKKSKSMTVTFSGLLDLENVKPVPASITVNKKHSSPMEIFSVIEFQNAKPKTILQRIASQETLNIPFFSRMLTESELMNKVKESFGIIFSYGELYDLKLASPSAKMMASVLQSHVPAGITLLCPLVVKGEAPIKIAFVISRPTFDLVIDKEDKISVRGVLDALSNEFSSFQKQPNFISNFDHAHTTHVSFDSSRSMFSIFARLNEEVKLAKGLINIHVRNAVLQHNTAGNRTEKHWMVSARGTIDIGKRKIQVQYSELSEKKGMLSGLTGEGSNLSLDDVLDQFNPDVYPDSATKEMIENTEINKFRIDKFRLFSRVPKDKGTPHILITGTADLPAWEKHVQVALLLLYQDKKWKLKMAASFKQSPLSNIIEALTGFDSRDIYLLHNTHIMTTLISSPFEAYSMLPPRIITTPLLRLPVAKALTIIALMRLPDNCGDDRMCMTATQLLGRDKVFTVKGVLALDGFTLNASLPEDIALTDKLIAVNNTLQFKISNSSSLSIRSSLRLPHSSMIFDGKIHLYRTGQAQIQMSGRNRFWLSPFGLDSLGFKDLQLVTFFNPKEASSSVQLEGVARLGAQGNGGEIEAPLHLNYNLNSPLLSSFHANFSNISLELLLKAFTIDVSLPSPLKSSRIRNGLMLSYSSTDSSKRNTCTMHGDIEIFGRLLSCEVRVTHPGTVTVVTDHSPAPLMFAKGAIIIQKDSREKLRGPRIEVFINHKTARLKISGYVKLLGMASETDVNVTDEGTSFSLHGKLMEFKDTELHAFAAGQSEKFVVEGCLEDVAIQIEDLLREIVEEAANQSTASVARAEQNLFFAQKYFEQAHNEETNARMERDQKMAAYEDDLLDYGRYEVLVNDTCVVRKCETTCFGCPELNRCCRLDIFGHCIECSSWKKCCWKNINPLCISKHDGCHVIRTLAEKELASKEAAILQQRILLDNSEQRTITAVEQYGKQKAVLEAAISAKQAVGEEASPGLNAADAIRNYGLGGSWLNIDRVCYNTTIEQASTGCLDFHVSGKFFGSEERVKIVSCLKDDLVAELTESLANYIFPNIVETSTDQVDEVSTEMNQITNQALLTALAVHSHSSPGSNTSQEHPSAGEEFVFHAHSNDVQAPLLAEMEAGNLTSPPAWSGFESGSGIPPAESGTGDFTLSESGLGVASIGNSSFGNQKAVQDLSKIVSEEESSGYQEIRQDDTDKADKLADEIVEDETEELENVKKPSDLRNETANPVQDRVVAREAENSVDDDAEAIVVESGSPSTNIPSLTNRALHRSKRDISEVSHSRQRALHGKASGMLFTHPFWNFEHGRKTNTRRSHTPAKPQQQKFMAGMIHKRWKIPDNPVGRCHIFHQLIAICKDMAETLVVLDKALNASREKFLEEDKHVSDEVKESSNFLSDSANRVNISSSTFSEIFKTLDVVKEGVNIWSKRSASEFDWQNTAGVQTWLTAMDLRIQQLGGFGVYRFLENLFQAFEALFEVLTYSDNTAQDALSLLQRIRRISVSFDKIFKDKLPVSEARPHANDVLQELGQLRKESIFC